MKKKKIVELRWFQPKSDLLAGLFDVTSSINEDHLNVANRYSLIPHNFPPNPRAKLRIDLQDD